MIQITPWFKFSVFIYFLLTVALTMAFNLPSKFGHNIHYNSNDAATPIFVKLVLHLGTAA